MSVAKNKQVVIDFYEAGNRGDLDTCFGLVADDVVWRNIGSTRFSGTYRGKQELMEKLLGPLFERLDGGIASDIKGLIGEGDRVVALTSGKAVTTDGRPYNNEYCQVIRVRDGKLAEVTEYMDTELVTRTFGPP